MKRHILCLLLALALLCGTASAAGTASPYAIKVNRALNTVTIYAQDKDGAYTVPVKAMICSTARSGYVTPLGTFSLSKNRSEWRLMFDDSYGQYACSFSGSYLFHSVCYSAPSHDALLYQEYNDLGSPASMGCVRLQVADAKWIYENCPAGTVVTIYDDSEDPGPLGKPDRVVDQITEETNNGWDPTDPAEGNPWTLVKAEDLTLDRTGLSLTAGEGAALTASFTPAEAAWQGVRWSTSDPKVATVDAKGQVVAMGQGTAVVTASCQDGLSAVCTVAVTGTLLPFDDVLPGAWYYAEVRTALDQGLFQGTGSRTFSPNAAMTRAMLVEVLYNQAGRPAVSGNAPFDDVPAEAWYSDAVTWAYSNGYVTGVSKNEFQPFSPLTREQLAVLLWRYQGCPAAAGGLDKFSDQAQVAAYAKPAVTWMVGQGYLEGSGGALAPRAAATRAQTAAILNRLFGN